MFPMCPASARGKPSASASTIVADRPCGFHDLKIDGRAFDADVPAGEVLLSAPFTVGGIRWRVRCYPNGYSYTRSPSPLPSTEARLFFHHLVLDENVAMPVTARFQFSIVVEQRRRSLFFLNSKPKKAPFKSEGGVESFVRKGDCGSSNVSRSLLGRLLRRHGTGHFTLRCEVVLINGFRTEATPPLPAAASDSAPPSDLQKHLGDLLASGIDADIVFEVGDETFTAHRCVLAARSPVIRKLLCRAAASDQSGTAGVVHIDGVEPHVFRTLLRYAYTDTLLVPEVEKDKEGVMYRDLLVAADRYHLVRLKLICEDNLCRCVVDAGAAVAMLALAEKHHCDRLKKTCLDFLKLALFGRLQLRLRLQKNNYQHCNGCGRNN